MFNLDFIHQLQWQAIRSSFPTKRGRDRPEPVHQAAPEVEVVGEVGVLEEVAVVVEVEEGEVEEVPRAVGVRIDMTRGTKTFLRPNPTSGMGISI